MLTPKLYCYYVIGSNCASKISYWLTKPVLDLHSHSLLSEAPIYVTLCKGDQTSRISGDSPQLGHPVPG